MTGRGILAVALVVAVAIIAALWTLERDANRRLRAQNAMTRRLSAQLSDLEFQNARLSNIVAQITTPLADEQLAELAKLREEVQKLRRQTNDVVALQTQLSRLRNELASARGSMGSNAPPDVPAQDIYPRDSWKFSGYDTPENTLESVTWAISQGDESSYMAGLSPELSQEMQGELNGADFSETGPLELGDVTGFRIADRQAVSDDEVIYTLYMDGEGDQVDMVLDYVNGAWVIVGEGQ